MFFSRPRSCSSLLLHQDIEGNHVAEPGSPRTRFHLSIQPQESLAIQCQFCRDKFATYDTLLDHTRTAHARLLAEVASPGNGFRAAAMQPNQEAVQEQQALALPVLQEPAFCRACDLLFKFSSLGQHMEREHPNPLQDTGPFQCQLCEASAFRALTTLERHMTVQHREQLPHFYTCPVCPKSFKAAVLKQGAKSLRKHLWSHNPQGKQFGCSRCGVAFSYLDALRIHYKKCDGTVKAPARRRAQPSVAKVAAGGRPLVAITLDPAAAGLALRCTKCGETFSHSDFETHMCKHKQQEIRLNYKCARCGDIFQTKKKIKKHLKTCRRPSEGRSPSKRSRKRKEDAMFVSEAELSDREPEDLVDSEEEFQLDGQEGEESEEEDADILLTYPAAVTLSEAAEGDTQPSQGAGLFYQGAGLSQGAGLPTQGACLPSLARERVQGITPVSQLLSMKSKQSSWWNRASARGEKR